MNKIKNILVKEIEKLGKKIGKDQEPKQSEPKRMMSKLKVVKWFFT